VTDTLSSEAPARARRGFSLAEITGGASPLPLMLMFGLTAADELDRTAFGILLPEIRDWFGVSLTTALTLNTVATLLTVLAAVPIGFLADRINRVRLVAAGAFALGVMSFLTGVAPTLLVLALVRFGSGVARTVGPAQQSVLADAYPPTSRAGIFSVYGSAASVGRFVGPLLAGWLAGWAGWQVPFFLFAIPSLLLGFLFLGKLREPARGESDGAVTTTGAPGLTESWRTANGVRSLRRIWWSLPFLVGGLVGYYGATGLLLDEVFHVGPGGRGVFFAAQEPVAVAGLLVGAIYGNRLMARRPGRVVTILGILGVIQSFAVVLVATAPNVFVAAAPFFVGAFFGAIPSAALISLMTIVIPARVRGFALGFGAVFVALGIPIAIPIGVLGDHLGLRWGILTTCPVLLIGSLIIVSAGRTIDADIRQAKASAAATASGASAEVGDDLLLVKDLDVAYGGVQALFGVDLTVQRGEILALLGANGAGKSTILRAICGTVPVSNGAVAIDGEDITFLPTSAHTDRGIVMVPGGKAVFPTLSVRDHLRLAAWSMRDDEALVAERLEQVHQYFPVLQERGDQPAGNLSGGEQQMLALGSALVLRPRLLLIDELSLGLSPRVVEQLLEIVGAIHQDGTTVVLVEQSINIAFTVADRAVFVEKGEVRFQGATADLLARPDILKSVMLGGGATTRSSSERPRAVAARKPVLEVRGLSKRFGGITAADDVDLVLAEGEILGLIGPNGSGKTTLFDLICGYVEPDGGQVSLLDQDVTWLSPDERARRGLHRSFQDARLFPSLTVEETVRVACERHLETRSVVAGALRLPKARKAERQVARRAERLMELLNLGAVGDVFVRELSTGSRRVVDLACVLAAEPSVLLLDEPAAGVAQAETEQLAPMLRRVRFETGCAILVIEHDMSLLCSLSDELVALEAGAVVTRGTPRDVLAHPRVIDAYLGTSESAVTRAGPARRSAIPV
jgi:ABC-type branched-subunit amino acid transport system ATPase component/predicted MFS family arabinose efflux permease